MLIEKQALQKELSVSWAITNKMNKLLSSAALGTSRQTEKS